MRSRLLHVRNEGLIMELFFVYLIVGVLVATGLYGATGVEQTENYYDE